LTENGPGVAIHHFVKSDPNKGFHDHPWDNSLSFVLAGGYEERLDKENPDKEGRWVNQWSFNYLDGNKTQHRIVIPEGGDAWTIFFYGRRSKTWGFWKKLDDGNLQHNQMTDKIKDNDGGWWKTSLRGWEIDKIRS